MRKLNLIAHFDNDSVQVVMFFYAKGAATVTSMAFQTKEGAWEHVKSFRISHSNDDVSFDYYHHLSYGEAVSSDIKDL